MNFKEIDDALSAAGVHLDPWDETFRDGKRPLNFDEMCAILPGATDCDIASWAEDRAVKMRAMARRSGI